jgi:membrane-bound lytic murein transglycosylase B
MRVDRENKLRRALFLVLVWLAACVGTAQAQERDFATWRDGFRAEALAHGIDAGTFDRAFAGIEPIPHIIELDHAQPETKFKFADYLARLASPARREGVRKHLTEDSTLLKKVGRRYGVPPRFIVALWGMETNFGHDPGDYPVIAALATLAYDGRRAAVFERELIAALRIVQRDGIAPDQLRGSWAGAMGQPQFMPSSFLEYAVSFSGGARPDIWNNRADVFASIANYLARQGWRRDQNWGRLVRAPANISAVSVGLDKPKSLAEWRRLGVKRADGGPLPKSNLRASLLLPEGGPAILIYDNFRALMRWNNAAAFATAVGLLADNAETH